MEFELLVVKDCVHAAAAAVEFAHALAAEGLPADFRTVVVESPEAALACAFPGSPTFRVDGRDVFAVVGNDSGLMCRLYPTSRGLRGLPDERELRRALREAALE